jgi:hypothetical protein
MITCFVLILLNVLIKKMTLGSRDGLQVRAVRAQKCTPLVMRGVLRLWGEENRE